MRRYTIAVAALGVGILIGATYAFALQARTTTSTVELMLAKFPSLIRGSSNEAATTTAPSNTAHESAMETLERTGEYHYRKPA